MSLTDGGSMQKYLVAIFLACSLMVVGYYLQCTRSSQDSWHVASSPTSLKGKDQYDVIIIGGGFGGLSCGAVLSQNGYKVLLCEKNDTVGGLCSSYSYDGFTFNYGAENVLGLGEYGALTYLMRKLRLTKESFFVRNSRRYVDGVSTFDIPIVPDALQNVLIAKYPSERTGINKFFSMAKVVYQEGYNSDMINRWGVILPEEISKKVMSREWVQAYPETHSHLIEWDHKSYQEVIDEYIVNPDLKLILAGFVSYLGKRPIEARASEVVLNVYDGFFSGSFHALGSPSRFAEALANYIEEQHGTVLTGGYVDKVDFADGAVTGVCVQGKKYWSHIVVSDVDVRLLFSELISQNNQTNEYAKKLHSGAYGRSALCLHLAVKDPLKKYPSLIQDRTGSTYVAISSENDSSLAPEGCSVVVAREWVNLADFIGRNGDDLDRYVDVRVSNLMRNAIVLVPELKNSATIVKVVTPDNFETLANIPNGAIFGFDGSKNGTRPYFKTPFKGLYVVSASSQNGPGVQEVVSNGILCAHDIMDWQE